MTREQTAPGDDDDCAALASRIGANARRAGHSVAAAESLTGGRIATELAAAPQSSSWFRGAVVAYSSDVKFGVLGVPEGPVISASCAVAMADGAARLTGADLAVAATGVGGPEEQEDRPVGTVFVAVHSPAGTTVQEHHLTGDPNEIVARTAALALQLLDARANGD